MSDIFLILIVLCVFFLPFFVTKAEENLEIFLFICGVLAGSCAALWSKDLLIRALKEPLHICIAIFFVGILFKQAHNFTVKLVNKSIDKLGIQITLALIVVILGFLSGIITAIVAALLLSEVASVLCIKRNERVKLVIYSCFAISAGAVLFPIGEPLSTIIISKLSGAPHNANSFFLLKLLWPYTVSVISIMAVLAYRIVNKTTETPTCDEIKSFPTFREIINRTLKVYLFILSLVFLGAALKPLAVKVLIFLSAPVLYWVNLVSAVLDNATVAAIVVVPEMTRQSLRYMLVSLIIGGGMLIPGNIPNIISASKLRIKSKEWAKIGIPLGMILYTVYFVALTLQYVLFSK
jgi:predicted cation transporter